MQDLTVSEAYFAFSVKNIGKLFGYNEAKIACLLSAVLYEMKQDHLISIDDTSIRLLEPSGPVLSYHQVVYDHLKNMQERNPEDHSLERFYHSYVGALSAHTLNSLCNSIGDKLAAQKLAVKAKLGLFGGRTYYMPHSNTLPALTAELQVNLLFQETSDSDDLFLWHLLSESECIPQDLSEETAASIRKRTDPVLSAARHILDSPTQEEILLVSSCPELVEQLELESKLMALVKKDDPLLGRLSPT